MAKSSSFSSQKVDFNILNSAQILELLVSRLDKVIALVNANQVAWSLKLLQQISQISTFITKRHSHIVRLNPGINWRALGALDQAIRFSVQDPIYNNRLPLLMVAIPDLAVTELATLRDAFHRIGTIPGYHVEKPIAPKLEALSAFLLEGTRLFTLSKEIQQGNFMVLDLRIPNHRIFALLTLARLSEAIQSLTPKSQDFFPKELREQLKTIRNIFFHPEKEENWAAIQKGLNANILKQAFAGIVKRYAVAKWVNDTLAYRKEHMFDDEPSYFRVPPEPQELWRILSLGLPQATVLPEVKSSLAKIQKTQQSYQGRSLRGYERENLTLLLRMHQVAYAFVTAKTGKQTKPEEQFKAAYEGLLSAEESNAFQKFLNGSTHDDASILDWAGKLTPKLLHPSVIASYKTELSEQRFNPLQNKKDLRIWGHHSRAIILQEISVLQKSMVKQDASLDKNRAGYNQACAEAEIEPGTNVPVPDDYKPNTNILIDYPSLVSKREQTSNQLQQKLVEFHNIDADFIRHRRRIELQQATHVIPKLVEALEHVQKYQPFNQTAAHFLDHAHWYDDAVNEFYQMVAGSLVRTLLDDQVTRKHNDAFVTRANLLQTTIDKEPFTLVELLRKFQVVRGLIAHVDQDLPGDDSQSRLFVDRLFNLQSYAKHTIALLQTVNGEFRAELGLSKTSALGWISQMSDSLSAKASSGFGIR